MCGHMLSNTHGSIYYLMFWSGISLFLLNMLAICARINCRLIYFWYAKQVPQFAKGTYAEDALSIPWQPSWGIKNLSQSEPPAPKPDTSPSLASLLCNDVYSWSFLKSNGTDDLHKAPAWWHRQTLTQIFDFLLPSVCRTPLPLCTAMPLYSFTPTAADMLSAF